MTQSSFAKPKVLIITTGGTIASVNGKPMIDGPALVGALPELGNLADIQVEEFSKIGSSKMTPALWLQLSQRVNQLLATDEDLNSVVITHGTDTLEETAYFLHLTIRSPKPVIVVGAMRSANEISADGPANLINAVRVGLAPEAVGSGVMVVLNERISAAREVWKTHNRGVDTFQSSSSFLGVVDPDKIRFYRQTLYAHTANTPFRIEKLDQLPKVELVMDFTDFDPGIIDYFASKGLDGLVVGSFAGGRISAGMTEGLKRAAGKGLPICIASQVPEGRIIGYPEYDFPVLFAPDLSPKKARILLMLSLLLTDDPEQWQAYFEQF
ncbi:MAG: asparaginase [Saprospiraceae bacterium]|nr:asparaginase [Saprospiraceae bacterium]